MHLTYHSSPVPSRASFLATAAALTVTMRTRKVGIHCLGEAPWQGEGQAGLGVSVRAQARGLTAGMSLTLTLDRSLEGKRLLELGKEEDFHPELESLDGDLDPGLPSTEDVILKTEQVTKNIQELLRAAQEFKHDRYGDGVQAHVTSGCCRGQRRGQCSTIPGDLP